MDAVPFFVRMAAALALALGALAAAAQGGPPRPDQIGKDANAIRQENEQQQARERERDRQEQASRQQAEQQWNDSLRQSQSRAAADAAQGQAVLRSWQQRPALAPDRNPLLGRWESLGSGGQRTSAPGLPAEWANLANQLVGGLTAELCDSMLGRGTIEFRPAGLVAIGRDGRERPMYRAEYRGGGSRVAVLPQGGTTFTHMIIDFAGPDRATVAGVGCALARAPGSGAKAAPVGNTAVAAVAGGAANAPAEWKLLGTSAANGGMDVYVAPATVRRSGSTARMADLWDFKSRQLFEGKPFLSARNEHEYDCARPRQRLVGTTGYSGHMGQGSVVARGDAVSAWEPVGGSGPLHEHWLVACRR